MSRTPRSAMIRKAHSLPKGDAERREILAGMGQTWGRQLSELKFDFMQEVVNKAIDILRGEGIRAKGDVREGSSYVKGEVNGEPMEIHYRWDPDHHKIDSAMTIGRSTRQHRMTLFSLSPENVASESIYKHFGGLID